jgi:hypothetical protein
MMMMKLVIMMFCSTVYSVELQPRAVHRDPKGEKRYRFSLPLTSALDRGGWSRPRPGHFTAWEYPVPSCTGGWVGLRAGLDGCGKSRRNQD